MLIISIYTKLFTGSKQLSEARKTFSPFSEDEEKHVTKPNYNNLLKKVVKDKQNS